MKKVTDPALLDELNGANQPIQRTPVTDPATLEMLDMPQSDWGPLVNSQSEPMDWDKAKENTPGSIGNFLEGLLMPVYRPDEFAQAFAPLAAGKAATPELRQKQAETIEAIKQGYADRYGSMDGFKRAIEEDPAGVLGDVGSLFSGGVLGAQRMIKGARAYGGDKALDMYEEAGGFAVGAKLDNDEVKDMVRFLLDEDIELSSDGLKNVKTIIQETGNEIEKRIAMVGDTGISIPRSSVVAPLEKLKKDLLGKTSDSPKDRKVIQGMIDGWIKEIDEVGKPNFTLQELQEFKQATYGKINWKGAKNKQTVKNSGFKAQGSEARQILEEHVPGIEDLNQRQGGALEAKPVLGQSVKRIDRRNNTGMDYLVKQAAIGAPGEYLAYQVGMPPGMASGLAAAMSYAGQPTRKGNLARFLYRNRKYNPTVSEDALAKAMMAAYPQFFERLQEAQ